MMCVCICVSIYVFASASASVCGCGCPCMCSCLCVVGVSMSFVYEPAPWVCIWCVPVCMHVCMCLYLCGFECICRSVCLSPVYLYVCLYVCAYMRRRYIHVPERAARGGHLLPRCRLSPMLHRHSCVCVYSCACVSVSCLRMSLLFLQPCGAWSTRRTRMVSIMTVCAATASRHSYPSRHVRMDMPALALHGIMSVASARVYHPVQLVHAAVGRIVRLWSQILPARALESKQEDYMRLGCSYVTW